MFLIVSCILCTIPQVLSRTYGEFEDDEDDEDCGIFNWLNHFKCAQSDVNMLKFSNNKVCGY